MPTHAASIAPQNLGFPASGFVFWMEPSPFGLLPMLASPEGLRRVGLDPEGRDQILVDLDDVGNDLVRSPIPAVSEQFTRYFAGELRDFCLPLDFALLKGFAREVTPLLATIPYGATTTYGALAAKAGKPGGARAVGNAVGRNPLPIILPCHRVLAAGGKIGGFTGGLVIKRALLAIEGFRKDS